MVKKKDLHCSERLSMLRKLENVENVFSIWQNEAALITGLYFAWKSNFSSESTCFKDKMSACFNSVKDEESFVRPACKESSVR